MEIRQARKSSVSIMPVFFCGPVARDTGGTDSQEEEGPAQGQEDKAQMEGRVRFGVSGQGNVEGTCPVKIST
jgi:hypothetical protein